MQINFFQKKKQEEKNKTTQDLNALILWGGKKETLQCACCIHAHFQPRQVLEGRSKEFEFLLFRE